MKKFVLLILLMNVVRVFTGCLECDNEPVPFDFTSIKLKSVDNTDTWIRYLEEDSMKRNAVAFEIELYTNQFDHALNTNTYKPFFGFSEAYALQECPAKYKPRQHIEKIEVISLFDLTDEIAANSNITNQCVTYQKNNSNLSYLYLSWDELYTVINPELYYDDPAERFQFFLKPGVTNDSLQLAINVHLSDDRVISGTTNVIYVY